MILIVSKESDHVTSEVLKWLYYYNLPFVRLGESEFLKDLKITINTEKVSLTFSTNNYSINYDEIRFFWFRKDFIHILKDFEINHDVAFNKSDYKRFLNNELNTVHDFLIHMLEKKDFLGNYAAGNSNKLIAFTAAKEVGLIVPHTILSTTIEDFKNIERPENWVVKPIQDYFVTTNEFNECSAYFSNIEILSAIDLTIFNGLVFPSCVQHYIDKLFEIRVFFIYGECYSMAIFSQLDEVTTLDFRNYNFDKPNRMCPFKLPLDIELKIVKLMKNLKLNTGSIDLILTPAMNYVFLEINPSGQFGMIENNAMHPLSKIIANKMKSLHDEK